MKKQFMDSKSGKKRGPPRYGSQDPIEKAILERIVYFRSSNGNGRPRKSFKEIADILNCEKIFTRKGHRFTAQRVLYTYHQAKG